MSDLALKFRSWSESLCKILEQDGLLVRPYQQASLPFFQALSESEQRQAISLIENYCAVCQDTMDGGASLREGRAVLDQALKHYNVQVDEEVFNFMGPTVVYEFYSANHTQFFRTANYFEYTSYTIEDIYSRAWMHLYGRDEEITRQIFEFVTQLLTGEVTEVIKPTLPEHLIIERASLERIKCPVRFECLAPLKQGDKIVGILCAVKSSGNFIE